MPTLGSSGVTNGQATAFSSTRSMVLVLPALDNLLLNSITVMKSGGVGRISAYLGGTVNDPSGAILLGSLLFPSGAGSSALETVTFPSPIAMVNAGVLRIAIQTGGNFTIALSEAEHKGDWYGPRQESSIIPGDLETAMPSVWPSDSTSVGSTYPIVQIEYSIGEGESELTEDIYTVRAVYPGAAKSAHSNAKSHFHLP
jgi:hypothetical protein